MSANTHPTGIQTAYVEKPSNIKHHDGAVKIGHGCMFLGKNTFKKQAKINNDVKMRVNNTYEYFVEIKHESIIGKNNTFGLGTIVHHINRCILMTIHIFELEPKRK